MSTVGALFVVFLGMSPKEEQMLQRLFKCRGLPLDVTERGANAAEIILDPRPQIIHLPLAPRRRHVTWADCRKYMVTIGCSACSDTAVRGKTSKLRTEECRTRTGEQMEHDPEGHER